ncbi:MAG: hypothetical protein U0Z53_17430 [Blastocatellia bacterium]
MNTEIISHRSSATARVIAGSFAFPLLPSAAEEISLQIQVPDFGLGLTASLREKPDFDSRRLLVQVLIDDDVIAVMTMTGRLTENGSKFRPEEIDWQVRLEEENPRAEFVASTLQAVFGLTDGLRLRIPEYQIDYRLNFEMPLSSVIWMLQRRQAAYRLMVIERATEREFLLPPHFSGDDAETISFLYHAIVERHCIWPLNGTVTIFIPALQENLEWLSLHHQPARYQLPPTLASRTLLGQEIPLGRETVIIEDGIVEDLDRIIQEMSSNDGHRVEVKLRSLSGQIRYELPESPRLPVAAWDKKIQMLIDLEDKLVDSLANRYHALAASTLANLTDEEKAEITARPELDEEAFEF